MRNGPAPDSQEGDAPDPARERRGAHYALEICFLAVVAVGVVIAFFEALTYKLVSSRTPFVIMVPLLVLIAVHARRLWSVRSEFHPGRRVSQALAGGNAAFNKVMAFCGWLVGLVIIITVLGHYAGIFLFCLILMRFAAGEGWKLSLTVAVATTFFIYGVFEFIFDIALYRGLVLRRVMGFRDF